MLDDGVVDRWVGYSNGRPVLVQSEGDAVTIVQESVAGGTLASTPTPTPTLPPDLIASKGLRGTLASTPTPTPTASGQEGVPFEATIRLQAYSNDPSWYSDWISIQRINFTESGGPLSSKTASASSDVETSALDYLGYKYSVAVKSAGGQQLDSTREHAVEPVDIDDDQTCWTDSTGSNLGELQNWRELWSRSYGGKKYVVECRVTRYSPLESSCMISDTRHRVDFACRGRIQ